MKHTHFIVAVVSRANISDINRHAFYALSVITCTISSLFAMLAVTAKEMTQGYTLTASTRAWANAAGNALRVVQDDFPDHEKRENEHLLWRRAIISFHG